MKSKIIFFLQNLQPQENKNLEYFGDCYIFANENVKSSGIMGHDEFIYPKTIKL